MAKVKQTVYVSDTLTSKPFEKGCLLIIPEEIWNKTMAWVDGCDDECGGYMSICKESESTYRITESYLPRQVTSAAYLRLEDQDCSRIKSELTKERRNFLSEQANAIDAGTFTADDLFNLDNKLKEINAENGPLKCQWHSHVNMDTAKSGTDHSTGLRLSENGDFIFMLILNKREKYSGYIYMREPAPAVLEFDLVIEMNGAKAYPKIQATKDLKENVFSDSNFEVNEEGMIEERVKYVQPQTNYGKYIPGVKSGYAYGKGHGH